MGTRGLTGFYLDGEAKLAYMQYDSYPSGAGVHALTWVKNNVISHGYGKYALKTGVADRIRAIRLVLENGIPTAEQRKDLENYTDAKVSTGTDWYSTLRNCQGLPGDYINAGYMPGNKEFGEDSLMCEWAYVIDIDKGALDVYSGFNTQGKPTEGLWAGSDSDYETGDDHYYAMRLLWSIPFEKAYTVEPSDFASACDSRFSLLPGNEPEREEVESDD